MNVDQKLWQEWRHEKKGAAFEKLVGPHLEFARKLAQRSGVGTADADDCVQRALFQLARENNDRPVSIGIRAWLGRAAKLQAKMLLRGNSRRYRREMRAARSPTASPTGVDRRDEVETILATLQPQDRESLVLRFLHDFEYRDIGYVLGVSESAARVRVHRALARLRRQLGTTGPALLALLSMPSASSASVSVAKGSVLMSTASKAVVACTIAVVATWSVFSSVRQSGQEQPRRSVRRQGSNEVTAKNARPRDMTDTNADRPISVGSASAVRERDPLTASQSVAGMRSVNSLAPLQIAISKRRRERDLAPDPITRRYLDELAVEFWRQSAEKKRSQILRTFGLVHGDYFSRTGDEGLLPFVSDVIRRGSSEDERSKAAGMLVSVDAPSIVPILRTLLESEDVAARRHAAMGLAASAREEAWSAVLRALLSDDSVMRWNAVMGLSMHKAFPESRPALLTLVTKEDDPLVAALAVRVLKARGASRTELDRAIRGAQPAVRKHLESGVDPASRGNGRDHR